MGNFSNRLKLLRKERNLKKKELANLLQVSERTYSYYESDERQPTLSNIEKLADYFGVSTDYLLGRTKDPQSNFSFFDELAKLEKNAFYKKFGHLINEVIKAIKRSVKIGENQASVCEIIEMNGNIIESEKALKLKLEQLLATAAATVDVKIRDLNAPFCFMEVSVKVSWGRQTT